MVSEPTPLMCSGWHLPACHWTGFWCPGKTWECWGCKGYHILHYAHTHLGGGKTFLLVEHFSEKKKCSMKSKSGRNVAWCFFENTGPKLGVKSDLRFFLYVCIFFWLGGLFSPLFPLDSNIAQLLPLKGQRTQNFFSKAVQCIETRFTDLERLLKCVKATFHIKAVAKSLIIRPLEVHRAVSAKAAKNPR